MERATPSKAILPVISPLNTDFYELKMMAGLFRMGKLDGPGTFDLYFRRLPFQGGYAIAAGLEVAIEALENLRFEEGELDYLRSLGGSQKIFYAHFLEPFVNLFHYLFPDCVAVRPQHHAT